jgi:hypothetical protein
MLEVNSFDEVGRAYDRMLKHKTKLMATLGRHVNDQMISFYMATPVDLSDPVRLRRTGDGLEAPLGLRGNCAEPVGPRLQRWIQAVERRLAVVEKVEAGAIEQIAALDHHPETASVE